MFPQFGHSGDYGPTAPAPTRCTSGAHQKTPCSLTITQEVEQLGAQERGRKREESRKQLSKHASDFPKWKQGERAKAGCGRKRGLVKALCTRLEQRGGFPRPSLPLPKHVSQRCPSKCAPSSPRTGIFAHTTSEPCRFTPSQAILSGRCGS